MKTQSLEWTSLEPVHRSTARIPARQWASVSRYAARALLALVPMLAIVVFSAWLVMQPHLAPYLQAVLWSAGFVFAALAVESDSSEHALLLLATAVVLPVLAFVSSRFAVEVAIVGATLIGIWVALTILRRP